MADLPVELRAIREDDTLTGLHLGDPDFAPLKTFLQRDAKKFHKFDLAKTYGLFLERDSQWRIIAYITLVCAEISVEDAGNVEQDGLSFRHADCPAVKIGRLAVHKDYQRNGYGLGTKLVQFALGLVKRQICPNVGCRFMVVDSKQKSVSFYKKCGFTMLDTDANRKRSEPVMWVDLTKVKI